MSAVRAISGTDGSTRVNGITPSAERGIGALKAPKSRWSKKTDSAESEKILKQRKRLQKPLGRKMPAECSSDRDLLSEGEARQLSKTQCYHAAAQSLSCFVLDYSPVAGVIIPQKRLPAEDKLGLSAEQYTALAGQDPLLFAVTRREEQWLDELKSRLSIYLAKAVHKGYRPQCMPPMIQQNIIKQSLTSLKTSLIRIARKLHPDKMPKHRKFASNFSAMLKLLPVELRQEVRGQFQDFEQRDQFELFSYLLATLELEIPDEFRETADYGTAARKYSAKVICTSPPRHSGKLRDAAEQTLREAIIPKIMTAISLNSDLHNTTQQGLLQQYSKTQTQGEYRLLSNFCHQVCTHAYVDTQKQDLHDVFAKLTRGRTLKEIEKSALYYEKLQDKGLKIDKKINKLYATLIPLEEQQKLIERELDSECSGVSGAIETIEAEIIELGTYINRAESDLTKAKRKYGKLASKKIAAEIEAFQEQISHMKKSRISKKNYIQQLEITKENILEKHPYYKLLEEVGHVKQELVDLKDLREKILKRKKRSLLDRKNLAKLRSIQNEVLRLDEWRDDYLAKHIPESTQIHSDDKHLHKEVK